MVLIFFLFQVSLSCNMSCRMGCDTFNGISSCYDYCACTFKYYPIPISLELKEKVSLYQLEIFKSLHCADAYLSSCNGSSIEMVECLKKNGCKVESGSALMQSIPKELWIAVQPSAIVYNVSKDQLEKYENYQKCASYCDELCVKSKESIETCSQNCMLQFCYSYDYQSGGYYETQIIEKKTEESYPDYVSSASYAFLPFIMVGVYYARNRH